MPFDFNIIITIISLVIGVIETAYGIISYNSSKKSNENIKTYEFLFKKAEETMDLSDKIEEINSKSEELNKLNTDINEMRKAIKENIPKEARRAVLYDRLKIEEEQLVENYNRYFKTKSLYKQLEETPIDIPEHIREEIEIHIRPEYLVKAMRQKYQTMLTVISYSTAIFSIIPVLNIIARYFIVFTLYPVIRIALLAIPKDKQERKQYIRRLINDVITVLFGSISFILGVLFTTDYYFRYNQDLFYID